MIFLLVLSPLLALHWGVANTNSQVQFVDVTKEAGLDFRHFSSPQKKHILDSMSGGVALFDFDGDNLLDIYFVSGLTTETAMNPEAGPSRLYRNRGNLDFTDVSQTAGVATPGWAMGAAAADYDGDGDLDLYVTCLGPNRLYRNNGDGSFTEVGATAGVADHRWSAGAAFADYDLDGDLDLFVANYVDVTLDTIGRFGDEAHCSFRGTPIQCDPRFYEGAGDALYRNNGDGTFSDMSTEAGVSDPQGYYGMGVIWEDFDSDGYPDLYVANDSRPSFLYRNLKNGSFEEIGILSGAALSEEGLEQGSMGLATGDYDRDGLIDIHATNFAYEYNSLYHAEEPFLFTDVTVAAKLADTSLARVGWGTSFLDFNNDGQLDLLAVNGHLYPAVDDLPGVGQRVSSYSLVEPGRYRQSSLLYQNLGDGTFTDATAQVGLDLAKPRVGRGAAVGDLDNDGDLDIVINSLDGPPALLRNDGGNSKNWLRVVLVGPPGNLFAVGARVELVADGTQIRTVKAGSSYLSQEDLRPLFGLGQLEEVERIVVIWPDGRRTTVLNPKVNSEVQIRWGSKEE